MSFVPRDGTHRLGERVRLNQDMSNADGVFEAGHEFHIIDAHPNGNDFLYDLRDRDHRILGAVSADYFTRIGDI
jgi:hypothetical protein